MLATLNTVLALFSERTPELAALDIAERLGRPRSSVYRLLRTFEQAGFLDYDERSGRYRLGIRLAALGALAQQSSPLQRALHPVLIRLARDSGECATLVVRSGAIATTVDIVYAPQPLVVPGVLGGHPPLHASAGGKVLTAWLAGGERRALLGETLTRYTAATITDLPTLMEQLDEVRRSGVAIARGEWYADVYGMGAPVWDHTGGAAAAVTIGFPSVRAGAARLRQLQPLVARAGAEGTAVLGGTPRVTDVEEAPAPVGALPHRSVASDRRRRRRD
ncbi:IclR family transcriptional regulator [Gemmatimonas sp.]|uniref:IclR family transcriptional regulator n=1 Tax=Gemmatimonas sp. TaxID=1962908 RepID=UPI0022C8537C|nr:IclR family transcriptional regulator [Gemmatimonas sp.]MCZ8203370.1 IclR family transcriptional regulator [Gemmatimonas sp.]